MSDFDSFRREVGAQVMPPSFDEVAATGRRRRLAATGWVAATVAIVVGIVALGVPNGLGNATRPVAPADTSSSTGPTPTTTAPPRHRLSATQVVNSPGSYLAAVAVSPASPNIKAVAWRYCVGHKCIHAQAAVTVTDDNFATSHDVALPGSHSWPTVVAVGDHSFYASTGGQPRLVNTDGTVRLVRVSQRVGPMAPGEVLIGPAWVSGDYLALNPGSAVAHPIPIPGRADQHLPLVQTSSDGTLVGGVGFAVGGAYRSLIWSIDGGATWRQHQLSGGAPDMVQPVPNTGAGHVLAAVRGGVGATFLPFDTVYRSSDGGTTWRTFDEKHGRDLAYLSWALVSPDGSLLVNIEAWSDSKRGHPSSHPVGLYESNGGNWGDLRFIHDMPSSAGSGRAVVSDLALGAYTAAPDGTLRLWMYDSSHGRLYESDLGIGTWAQVPAR